MLTVLSYAVLGIFLYLSVCTLYFVVIAIANGVQKEPDYTTISSKRKVAVFIPCYKEDTIILDTARAAISHPYPATDFDVFVIADSMRPDTIERLRALPVHVIEVSFDVSSKARSLNAALHCVDEDRYDIAFVLDADNVMSPGTLEKVNHAFAQGARAVQCRRIAKNLNTPVALLECINEELNNVIFRQGQRSLGLSATCAGSGMAFEFGLLKAIFNQEAILHDMGEDKEIDLQLLKMHVPVEYIAEAFIYDEKAADVQTLKKQRLRWIEVHLKHMGRFLDPDIMALPIDRHLLNKLMHYLILPRSFFVALIGAVVAMAVADAVMESTLLIPGIKWWTAVIGAYAIATVSFVPAQYMTKTTLKSLSRLPSIVTSMVVNMFRVRVGRKEFLHTEKKFIRL
jgi:cellulose synthase/poly-beta-1,6-N-acetylglucosamine synthase-like glycosyltransferase